MDINKLERRFCSPKVNGLKIRHKEPGKVRHEEPGKVRHEELEKVRHEELEKVRHEEPGKVRHEELKKAETRAKGDADAGIVLHGRAMVLGEFVAMEDRLGDSYQEKFSPECLKNTLSDGHKIMMLFNHDWSSLMGSTNDNLKLEAKDDGLYFEFTPKDFEFDRRVIELIRSGTIEGCSIGFIVNKQEWTEKDGLYFRVIEEIDLYEVTFTPIPAYEQTSVEIKKEAMKAGEAKDCGAIADEELRLLRQEVERIDKLFSKNA